MMEKFARDINDQVSIKSQIQFRRPMKQNFRILYTFLDHDDFFSDLGKIKAHIILIKTSVF
jgi:hypothetical protein